MPNNDFFAELKRLNLKQIDFCKMTDLNTRTLTKWKANNNPPKWASVLLKFYEDSKTLESLTKSLKN